LKSKVRRGNSSPLLKTKGFSCHYFYKRQEVLDVLAVSMKKARIRKPEAYLQTLIQRSLADDFTPIKPQKSLKDKVDSKQEKKKAIEQCPYCDQSGYIHIE
jgi:hypothetical protein